MNTSNAMMGKAFVEKMANLPWREYPGQFGGALSKPLAAPDNTGSSRIDFRISSHASAAYVSQHLHKIQEQVYQVLEGEGVLALVDDKHLMRPHDYVNGPPGIRHSFTNAVLSSLMFLVITTPADDEGETP